MEDDAIVHALSMHGPCIAPKDLSLPKRSLKGGPATGRSHSEADFQLDSSNDRFWPKAAALSKAVRQRQCMPDYLNFSSPNKRPNLRFESDGPSLWKQDVGRRNLEAKSTAGHFLVGLKHDHFVPITMRTVKMSPSEFNVETDGLAVQLQHR